MGGYVLSEPTWRVLTGDSLSLLAGLPSESVQTCVTSPPYWGLRDYGADGQLGLEATPAEYVANLAATFREVRRVLRADGTLWLNLGDSYAAGGNGGGGNYMKAKDLVGIPWMVAFALRDDGWYLRSDVIWSKPNPMPESVTDRPTKAHEYLFLLAKSPRYYYDADAISESTTRIVGPNDPPSGSYQEDSGRNDGGMHRTGGFITGTTRNKRSVWIVATQPFLGAHFATFPPKLIEPCVLAGAPEGGTVLDPFNGAGTTGLVALRNGRSYVGLELNPTYADMARNRIRDDAPMFNVPAEEATI